MRASGLAALLVLCCAIGEDVRGAECPEDSVLDEKGDCKCLPDCPVAACPPRERPIEVEPANLRTPGNCCARYDCVPSESAGWAKVTQATQATQATRATRATEKSTRYCIHEQQAKKPGERWQQSDCVSCVCEEEEVTCQETMCKSCDNAIAPEPGECCPHCPIPTNGSLVEPKSPCQTSIEGCSIDCEHGYETDENDCPVCSCVSDKENDEDASTERSTVDLESCLPVPFCESNCELTTDEEGCPVCACRPARTFDEPANDTVVIDETGKKICPEVKCDLHCERGLLMDENDCTFCKCRAPDSDCPPLIGCRKRCVYGYKTNKHGCSICRCKASCTDRLNVTHPEGSTWHPNSCTACTCQTGGRLGCRETICSVACSDPSPPKPGTCCPICPIATTSKENETATGGGGGAHHGTRGWGTAPIVLIAILTVLCLFLIVHIVRSRFRGRLSPSETTSCSSCPPQYYKYVPAYDTPTHRHEKIVPL